MSYRKAGIPIVELQRYLISCGSISQLEKYGYKITKSSKFPQYYRFVNAKFTVILDKQNYWEAAKLHKRVEFDEVII
jgi:hypothetical protein